ncbi:MAG: hypothetical protein M3168_04745 [Actinomycetota bacterium]|nr:hypothetical protein [Actinomycetota bacterium]
MARSLLARLHNPRGRRCGCPPSCFCKRTAIGRLLRWYIPARFHGMSIHREEAEHRVG